MNQAPGRPDRERKLASYLLLALCICLLLFQELQVFSSNDIWDDAFITFRYATHLAEGEGLVWNRGEAPVEGFVHHLYIWILALFIRAGADPVVVSALIGMLAGLGTLILVFVLCRRASGGPLPVRYLAVILTASSTTFAFWARSGLETHLFAFLTTAGVLTCVFRGASWTGMASSGLLFALATLTRPEAVLFFGGTLMHRMLLNLNNRRTVLGRGEWAFAVAYLAVFLPFWTWRTLYFGYFFPNVFYTKTGGGLSQALRGARYLFSFFFQPHGFVYLGALLVLFRRRLTPLHGYLLVLTGVWFLYVIFIGGDWFPQHRFLLPLLPLLFFLLQEGVRALVPEPDAAGAGRYSRVLATAAGTLLLTAVCGYLIYPTLLYLKTAGKNPFHRPRLVEAPDDSMDQNYVRIGRYFRSVADPDATLAVIAAGGIPFYSGLRTLDMLGLNDVYIAHQEVSGMGSGVASHEKGDGAYVLGKQPDYLILYSYPTPEPEPFLYDAMCKPVREIASTPDLCDRYRPVSVRLDNDYFFNYFVRTDREPGGERARTCGPWKAREGPYYPLDPFRRRYVLPRGGLPENP